MPEPGHLHRNVSTATFAGFKRLLLKGQVIRVRGQEVREIRNHMLTLINPLERCLFVPHRRNNIFVSLAETIWVLAGRNDIKWLSSYLPRAIEFSDDGLTWRGGYGPRLRNWNGVDQIGKIRDLLLSEADTRRATISLFDPARDFVNSKDIPCNNWLHWLIRDGKLNLNVVLRSNDIVWGFSGINCFEWSVLHEAMAFWLGVPVGDATYFASSFHIYSRHYSVAEHAVRSFKGVSCYDFGLHPPPFQTPWKQFDKALATWFQLEEEMSIDPARPLRVDDHLTDPFLISSLELLRIYRGALSGWTDDRISDEFSRLPPSDMVAAAYEYVIRTRPALLEKIAHREVAAFLSAYLSEIQPDPSDRSNLIATIKSLHQQKNTAYGPAWKRRGEFTSILANIARKVDRLEQYQYSRSELADETIGDTVLDLFVYCNKYLLFLLERLPNHQILPSDAPRPYSDHVSNFDWLVENIDALETNADVAIYFSEIIAAFDELHVLASNKASVFEERFILAKKLRDQAFALLYKLNKMS